MSAPTRNLTALLVSTVIGLAVASPASAQTSCMDYTNDMVRMDRLVQQRRCEGWKGHSDFSRHFEWCIKNPDRAAEALKGWHQAFGLCLSTHKAFPSGADPSGPADEKTCQDYAKTMTHIVAEGAAGGCVNYLGIRNSEDEHLSWCRTQTIAAVRSAIAFHELKVDGCRSRR